MLIADARARRDDSSLRRLLRQRDGASKHERDKATDAAKVLQDKALKQLEEHSRRRAQAKKEDQAARLDLEMAAARKAEANERAELLKQQTLRESLQARREDQARKEATRLAIAKSKWIQTEYPRALAVELARKAKELSAVDKSNQVTMLKYMSKENWFRFWPNTPNLWEPELRWLVKYGEVKPLDGGPPRVARCSAAFDTYLDEIAPPSVFAGPKKPEVALRELLESVFTHSTKYVFCQNRSLLRFLHLNDYIIDKAFVSAVICLSKWLRKPNWADGIYTWPPEVPPDVLKDLVPDAAVGSVLVPGVAAGSDLALADGD